MKHENYVTTVIIWAWVLMALNMSIAGIMWYFPAQTLEQAAVYGVVTALATILSVVHFVRISKLVIRGKL